MMNKRFVKFLMAGVSPAFVLMMADQAFGQATGTLTVEQVEVSAAQDNSFEGVVSQQESPKTREIITQQYISQQPTGANALSDLNLVPGVNFTNDDPYGMSGSGGQSAIHAQPMRPPLWRQAARVPDRT